MPCEQSLAELSLRVDEERGAAYGARGNSELSAWGAIL